MPKTIITLLIFALGFGFVPNFSFAQDPSQSAEVTVLNDKIDPSLFVYNVSPEWLFISPVTNLMIGKPIKDFFPNLENVYYFDNGYKIATNFVLGQGYWLKNKTNQTIYATGTPITSVTYNLPLQGKYLIGAPFTINLKDVPCVIDVLHYNIQTNSYESNFEIAKGSAAFVKTNSSCSFYKSTVDTKVVISNLTATNIIANGVTFSWDTNILTSMDFGYKKSSDNQWIWGGNQILKTHHEIIFENFQPATIYEYQVRVRDNSGVLLTQSEVKKLTTLADSQVPPTSTSTNEQTSSSFNYILSSGWNFIAPVMNEMVGKPISNYFPEMINVYYHDGSYKLATNFEQGKGYWLNNSLSKNITVSGTPITTITYNLIGEEQHLIGIPFAMNLDDVSCIVDIQAYNKYTNTYYYSPNAEKGSSIWVKTNSNCSFTKSAATAVVNVVISDPVITEITELSAKVKYSVTGLQNSNPSLCYGATTSSLLNCVNLPVSNKKENYFETNYTFSNLQANTSYYYQLVLDKSTSFERKSKVSSFKTNASVAVVDNKLFSPHLFALNGQVDKEGKVNSDIYASFNRMISGGRMGKGVEKVKISLILPTMGPTVVSDNCELDLIKNSNTCQSLEAIGFVSTQANNQALLKINMSQKSYESVKFDITYSAGVIPVDYTVNIGDSISNDGWGGDAGHQSNDSEVQIYNTHLSIFGDDNTVGERRLHNTDNYVSAGDIVSITVKNNYVEWSKIKLSTLEIPTLSITPVDSVIAEIKERATLLYEGEISSILSELNTVRNTVKEQENELKYLINLVQNLAQVNETMKLIINHFITYGVDENSLKLGEGERAAVVYSFKEAFGKLPESEIDFEDVIKIANGRWPGEKSEIAESKAKESFRKIYLREAQQYNPNDQAAITIMAYGLRQKAENRNLVSEQNGLKIFADLYGKRPETTSEWNILQAITYSGATRVVIDGDNDGLSDEMERRLGTDPNNSDTDGDGYLDGQEVVYGYDPLQKSR